MRATICGILLGLCVAGAGPATAQTGRAERAHDYLESFARLRLFSGAALVVDDGEVLNEGAFGLARRDPDVENRVDTRFRIGSLTKQFTAALIMRLVEQDRLALDAPVRRYIPEYPTPQGDRVTIHHLLTHTSGIPSYTDVPGFIESNAERTVTPHEILEATWERELAFDPGERFAYSNSGYVLLGWIVERVTDRSYPEALRELVLDPLGLENTGYAGERTPPPGHALGYNRTLTGYEPARLVDPSLPYSAGMLYSTVGDLHRWGRALALDGPGPFEDPATLRRMLTPERDDYAYGVFVSHRTIGREDSVRVVEHAGEVYGFSSVLRVFPDHRRMIVLLDNGSADPGPILEGLTNLLWGAEAAPPRPSIAERILPIVESAGVEPAIRRYESWRRTRPDDYEYGPGQLMLLARHFRERGDIDTAIDLLEAEARAFPRAPITRYALFELHLGRGDTARAVSHLEDALLSHPGEPHLIQPLLALGVEPAAALRLPPVAVDPAALDRVAGSYRIDPGTRLEVRREGDRLVARRTGEDAFPLIPQSESTFLLEGTAIQFVFLIRDGEATAVSVLEAGQRVTFPRDRPPR